MTKKEGDKVQKGFPIGLSGSTGLSSGPHLHFGIKPNSNDSSNGYYGKIDPLPYLALKEGNQDVLGERTNDSIIQLPTSSNSTLRVISYCGMERGLVAVSNNPSLSSAKVNE